MIHDNDLAIMIEDSWEFHFIDENLFERLTEVQWIKKFKVNSYQDEEIILFGNRVLSQLKVKKKMNLKFTFVQKMFNTLVLMNK